MLEIVRPLRAFLRHHALDSTNTIWRLHSRFTVLALVFFTILLSARTYFGGPIECISTATDTVRANMNNFCWILGTFISKDPNFVFSSWDFIEIGHQMGEIPKEQRLYQKYYQWVPFLLAIQAFLFSFSKHLWRFYEGGQLSTLCNGLMCILRPADWTGVRKFDTLHYLATESRRKHANYAFVFFGCECLNFLIVLLNMFIMNFIFGGFWNSYEPAVRALLSLDMNTWATYNSLVFPKLAKCDFHYIGPSGSRQVMDGLCLLPHNIVNEKIFAFLWLWFIVLAIVTGIHLCYRLIQLCCESVRIQLLYSQLEPASYKRIKRVVREANIGHWFLLYQMSRNINKGVMREIIYDLSGVSPDKSQSRLNIVDPGGVEVDELEDDEVTV